MYAFAQNSDVCGGAMSKAQAAKIEKVYELALKTGTPVIGIYDSVGARVSQGVDMLQSYGKLLNLSGKLAGVVPQISVVLGPCEGTAALLASEADFVIQSEQGKFTVKTNGDGGSADDNMKHGVIAVKSPDESSALQTAKELVSMLPRNNLSDAFEIDIPAPVPSGDLISEFADGGSFIELNAYTGNQDIGKLYADLGDIFYFKEGDAKGACENYEKAIENKNDIPSIRYKIGYLKYNEKKYDEALASLMVGSEAAPSDTHMLLALANTLWNRSDFYAARGYYDKLLEIMEEKRQGYKIILPQIREDHGDFVDTYMKASNNLGATLSRIANMSGNSEMNGQAIVALQDSLRAWDALSRNQETMVRLDSSNLAEQNIKYITRPDSEYSPEIYTKIPMLMDGEEGLE